ncbi:hypothetical protein GCM10022291_24610 [Postechiella marina]|uniref:Uncharacterized protein n=1 Tax=Postechiella marina TaxID=943941 RepID=A0ABP8CCI5_9FLAO
MFYYKTIAELKDVKYIAKSFEFFNKKANQALVLKDSVKSAYYLELIAVGQFKIGFPYDSEATSIKALKLLNGVNKKTDLNAAKQRLANQLGMIYRRLENFDNAHRYYNEALSLNNGLKGKIAILTNIANLYADQEKYKEASLVLSKYYNEVLAFKDSEIKATFIDNLGYFGSKLKDKKAILNMNKALEIRSKLKDLSGLFSSYRHLSLYYLEQGNLTKATFYSQRAQDISNIINTPAYQLEALAVKLNLENNQDFKKYIALSKAEVSKKQLRENKFEAIKYDIANKQKLLEENIHQLELSVLENEKQRTYKWLYFIIGLFVIFISIFTFFFLQSRHRKEKLKEVYITEKRISKKVHDEVANDVYQVMTKLQINNTNKNEKLLDDLEDIYNKTRDISKASSAIDLSSNFDIILNDLFFNYKVNGITIITQGVKDVDWNQVSVIKRTTIYRVLQELMTNMSKHSQASLVSIVFNQDKRKIEIKYKDNGVGAQLNKLSGLENVDSRIRAIKGNITFETSLGEGFKVNILI